MGIFRQSDLCGKLCAPLSKARGGPAEGWPQGNVPERNLPRAGVGKKGPVFWSPDIAMQSPDHSQGLANACSTCWMLVCIALRKSPESGVLAVGANTALETPIAFSLATDAGSGVSSQIMRVAG